MLHKIMMSKSKTFLAFCFSFLAGVAVGSIYNHSIPSYVTWFLLYSTLLGIVYFYRHTRARFICLILFIFVLGVVRYMYALPQNTSYSVMDHYGETVTFTGMVADEPDVRQDGVRYIVKIMNNSLSGKVYAKTLLYPRYHYGEILKVECTLVRPEPVDDFRYDMYLARYGVSAICNHPKLAATGTMGGSTIKLAILDLKQAVADRVDQLWPEPYAGFMAGLLYGYRGGLGSLNTDFARTGVSHIVAVSGYNISLVTSICMIILIRLFWIPRKTAFWIIVSGIVLFVIFTGASSSVVRAGVMAIIVLLGGYLGRPRRTVNALVVTAVVMIVGNPLILFWDAGFQLSFLSTLGIIYLSPILTEKLNFLPDRWGWRESLVSTLAAIIGTLPLLLYQFGQNC
jgi:competence protein ComEC